MISSRYVPGILLLWSSSISSFQGLHRLQKNNVVVLNNNAGDGNAGPMFPSSFTPQPPPPPQNPSAEDENDTAESPPEGQANTRFSKFAPDLSLDATDFRLQLRENMKADLERRRNEDPSRGHQISKTYLDSL